MSNAARKLEQSTQLGKVEQSRSSENFDKSRSLKDLSFGRELRISNAAPRTGTKYDRCLGKTYAIVTP